MIAARSLAVAALAGLGLCAGCATSSNKGRIEGKWRIVSDDSQLQEVYLTFGEDGFVTMERPAPPRKSVFGEVSRVESVVWRYKLLAGDAADLYDLPADATARAGLFPTTNGLVRTTIRIESTTGGMYEGREMTLTTADGQTLRLTWVR